MLNFLKKNSLKSILLIFVICLFCKLNHAQTGSIRALKQSLEVTKNNETRIGILFLLGDTLSHTSPEEAIVYAQEALRLSKKLNNTKFIAQSYELLGTTFLANSLYSEAISNYIEGYQLYEGLKNNEAKLRCLKQMANVYFNLSDYANALNVYNKSLTIASQNSDTASLIETYIKICDIYTFKNSLDSAVLYLEKSIALCQLTNSTPFLFDNYLKLAKIFLQQKKTEQALDLLEKNLTTATKLKDSLRLAKVFKYTGDVYMQMKNFEQAYREYETSYAIAIKHRDENLLPELYLGIGLYYLNAQIGKNREAIELFKKAIDINKKQQLNYQRLELLNNLSRAYSRMRQYDSAYYNLLAYKVLSDSLQNTLVEKRLASLRIKHTIDREQVARKMNYESALASQKQLIYFFVIAFALVLALVFIQWWNQRNRKRDNRLLNEQKNAITIQNEALKQQNEEILSQRDEISAKNTELELQKEEIRTHAEKYEQTNRDLEMLSLVASKTENAIIIMDENGDFKWINDGFTRLFEYTFDELVNDKGKNIVGTYTPQKVKKFIDLCIQTKEPVNYDWLVPTKSGVKKWIHTTLTPVLESDDRIKYLIAIDSDINAVKLAEIENAQQREKLEKQNERINSSLRYAQTIQSAILPPIQSIREAFGCFIMFKPKDIVSGDFYWYNTIVEPATGKTLKIIAVVDCTGHGVPGAFMTMIAYTLLNEIILFQKITNPSQVLDLLNEGIYRYLRQEETDSNEGMDTCLCIIETLQNTTIDIQTNDIRRCYNITFSGAELPLYYFDLNKSEVDFLKGDKKNIGGVLSQRDDTPFTNQELILRSGDMIYLTTDGLQDQNAPNRKRFGQKRLVETLNLIACFNIEQQFKILNNTLTTYQQEAEQRDDITLVGLCLP